MRLGKSFGISFAIYVGIIFGFNVLLNLVFGGINMFISNIWQEPLVFIASFFQITFPQALTFIHIGSGGTATPTIFFGPNIRIMPPGYGILNSFNVGIFSISIFESIILVIASILPGLFTSIFAAKNSDSKNKAVLSWMLVMVLSGVVLSVLYIINPTEVAELTSFITTAVTNKISVAIWIFVFEIMIGLFYSGFALIFYKRSSVN